MKKQFLVIVSFLLFFCRLQAACLNEIPFTLEDRDRIIRSEQKLESLEKQVDGLRSEMNTGFNRLFTFLWAIVGIFTTALVSVFGFAFWDRK